MLDVQKERLLEEFVKKLIQQLEESKQVAGKMEVHEHEILELMGEWSHYTRFTREVRSVKQDLLKH